MPRITAPDQKNELKIYDNRSGEEIVFFYRDPSTQEFVSYQNKLFKRKGTKLVNATADTRLEFGKKILLGFKDGCFAKVVDGQEKLYSSDPQSPEYDPEWKDFLGNYAADLVMLLAQQIFEPTFL